MTIPPGEGERRAQAGLVPQYKIAAEKVYSLIGEGRLREVGIADPKAQTLDDLQLVWTRGSRLILDAYQIKWAKPGTLLQDGEFRALLAEMVDSRRSIITARADDDHQEPVDRVISHLYTSQAASTNGLRGKFAGQGLSLHGFLEEVWRPAERELLADAVDIDPKWNPYVEHLAKSCQLDANTLLQMAPDLRIELGQVLVEETLDAHDREAQDYLDDLLAVRGKLQDLVTDRHKKYIWLTAEELVDHLGDDWKARWRPRQDHVFPTVGPYEPVAETVRAMSTALDRFDQGYVVLTGSPGSGKSTLLTRLLRTDDRLAARYYAYVPEDGGRLRGEAGAFLHDLFLAISGRRGRRVPAPRGTNIDTLRDAFREELERLGERARKRGQTEIVLIDGLDHVRRDPQPHHPMLSELPHPEHVPDGVLLVLGTRSVGDLPAHVARGIVGNRHIEAAPLPRDAVLRLCERAGLGEVGDRIETLSAGHPLLVRTYLKLAAGLAVAERQAALASLPESSGEIWGFYETVWETVAADADVVGLLGMACRLRGTIRFSWLIETGTSAAEITRLHRLDYLFARSGDDRWTFFHSSFREFLRMKTGEIAGVASGALDRSYHRELAERCHASPNSAWERFDELHHLVESGDPAAALAAATPAYFRDQVDGLRPRAEVAESIRDAARALGETHDPMGVVRLALAAEELEVRGYQFPETTEFLRLLVQIGQPELAIAHLGAIDNGSVGHDRRSSAMGLAIALQRASLTVEALRVFERHEPVSWLGGRPSAFRTSPRGERPSLYVWARTAAVLRGAPYLLEAVAALRVPDDEKGFGPSPEIDVTKLRCELLWVGADELHRHGIDDGLAEIRQALVDAGTAGRRGVASIDLDQVLAQPSTATTRAARRQALAKIDEDALTVRGRIELAHELVDADEETLAQELFERLDEPDLPERDFHGDRDVREWQSFFAYFRVGTVIGKLFDPVETVPAQDSDYRQQAVLAARHVVSFAVLEGRQMAGQAVTASEVVAHLRRMHAFWDSDAPVRQADRPAPARSLMSRRAIAIAERIGPHARDAVFAYFRARWAEKPVKLFYDSTGLILDFYAAGVGPISVRQALSDLEQFTEESDSSPDEWVSLGLAWNRVGEAEGARRCCERAVGSTLTLNSDKDVRLETWTKLAAPLLDGPDGELLAEALTSAFIELDRARYGGSPELAAAALVGHLASTDPLRAWEQASRFLDHRLVDADLVSALFLSAMADRPSEHWWTALSEIQIAIGGHAFDTKALERAVAANRALARRWLPDAAERVNIEGRPTARSGWRKAIAEALHETGLATELLGKSDLEMGHDSPPEPGAGADTSPREETTDLPVEEQLRTVEQRDGDGYVELEQARNLVGRIDDLDEAQTTRLVDAVRSTSVEASLNAALVKRALDAGDPDAAWKAGVQAIACSESSDWYRDWAGGPIIRVIAQLQQIDETSLPPIVFSRLSELAVEEPHFLSSLGRQLDSYMIPLGLPAPDTAREVLGVAAAVLRDVASLPDPTSLRTSDAVVDAEAGVGTTDGEAIDAFLLWLLNSRYILGWQAAQRALVRLARLGKSEQTLTAALSEGSPTALRACAVIETVASSDVSNQFAGIAPALAALVRSPSLAIRVAATQCLVALDCEVPAWPDHDELPAALRIELPADGNRDDFAQGIPAQARRFQTEVEDLAEATGIDPDTLFERVLTYSRQAAGSPEIADDEPARLAGVLGWGFLKPSAEAIRTGLDRVAAELTDARRVAPADALLAAGLWPVYDSSLLAIRPSRRPSAVATFIGSNDRQESGLYKRPVTDLAADADLRVAREVDGWHVLGERSEIVVLGRLGHSERRLSGAAIRDAEGYDADARSQFAVRPWPASDYRNFRATKPGGRCALLCEGEPMASPDTWLALHPRIADAIDLQPDPSDPFAWRLDDKLAVRSIWWRSGYTRWQPHSDADEVGEGWLVVATSEVLDRLAQLGRVALAWTTATTRRGDSDTSRDETQTNGTFEFRAGGWTVTGR